MRIVPKVRTINTSCSTILSTESADGSGCLKFYRALKLIGIYAEIKKKKKKKATHKEYTHLFVKCNLRAESKACATDLFF